MKPLRVLSLGQIVCGDEVGEVLTKLLVTVVVEAPDSGLLDGSVHPLNLTVGPWMLCLSRAVLDIVCGASVFEGMSPEALAVGDRLLIRRCGCPSWTGCRELIPIVGEHRVYLIGAAAIKCRRSSREMAVVAFSCSSTKTNFEVWSIATNMCSLPCSVRTSAMSM